MTIFFSYTRISQICISVFIASLIGLYANHAKAAGETCSSPAFLIKNVEIAVDAESGEVARIQATASGRYKAWQRLKKRVLLPAQNSDFDTEETETVIENVLDYTSIVQETVLETRYQAILDYCFDRLKVRQYFAEKGLGHAELISGDMLVLPIWNEDGNAKLWKRPNPWMDAWQRTLETHLGLVEMKLPSSLSTERSIQVDDLLKSDQKTIAKAAELENAERVIIAILTPKLENNKISISMMAKLYRSDGRFDSDIYTLDTLEIEVGGIAPELNQRAFDMAQGIDGVWRIANQINFSDSGVLFVHIPATSIDAWNTQINIVESLPPVEKLEIIQLSSEGGIVKLQLVGTMEALSNALEQYDYKIEDQRDREDVSLVLVSAKTDQ